MVVSQKVEGCLLQLKGKHHSNAQLPKDIYIGNHCEMADSCPPPGVVYRICIRDVGCRWQVHFLCQPSFDQFLPIFSAPKTTTDWNPLLSSTSAVEYRGALPSPSMQGHTMQLHHWAIAGWGLVARTRRLRGNRLHYWMVAMNRELRYCNN